MLPMEVGVGVGVITVRGPTERPLTVGWVERMSEQGEELPRPTGRMGRMGVGVGEGLQQRQGLVGRVSTVEVGVGVVPRRVEA